MPQKSAQISLICKTFWSFFKEKCVHFETLEQVQIYFPDLRAHLQQLHPSLSFEFELQSKVFTLSADGDPSAFASAEELFRYRPTDLTAWTFQLFKPPVPELEDLTLTIGEVTLEISKIRAGVLYDDGAAIVILFLPGCDPADSLWPVLGKIVLMLALGEYDATTKVDRIDVYPLEDTCDIKTCTLMELRQLVMGRDRIGLLK